MTKNLADLRFAVMSIAGQVSNTWRLWVTKHGDVYLATRFMAKIEKYSFHKSGICRSAFTEQFGISKTMTDRAIFKWKRLPTPPAGEGKASRVALLAFPTNYLSGSSAKKTNNVLWIEAAPYDSATYIELAFTYETQESIKATFSERKERKLLTYIELPSKEAVFMSYSYEKWDNKTINMPGNNEVADLIFSPTDTYNTGRPIRIRFGPRPSDGDALVLQELGGYASYENTVTV